MQKIGGVIACIWKKNVYFIQVPYNKFQGFIFFNVQAFLYSYEVFLPVSHCKHYFIHNESSYSHWNLIWETENWRPMGDLNFMQKVELKDKKSLLWYKILNLHSFFIMYIFMIFFENTLIYSTKSSHSHNAIHNTYTPSWATSTLQCKRVSYLN